MLLCIRPLEAFTRQRSQFYKPRIYETTILLRWTGRHPHRPVPGIDPRSAGAPRADPRTPRTPPDAPRRAETSPGWFRCMPSPQEFVVGTSLCAQKPPETIAGGPFCAQRPPEMIAGGPYCAQKPLEMIAGGPCCAQRPLEIFAGASLCIHEHPHKTLCSRILRQRSPPAGCHWRGASLASAL